MAADNVRRDAWTHKRVLHRRSQYSARRTPRVASLGTVPRYDGWMRFLSKLVLECGEVGAVHRGGQNVSIYPRCN